MSDRDRANLLSILDAIRQIGAYTGAISDADEFYARRLEFDASLMNFVLIGEMCARVSEELKSENADIAWNEIKGFRNLIAHDYMGVDAEEVWQIIQDDLPSLESQIRKLIDDLPG